MCRFLPLLAFLAAFSPVAALAAEQPQTPHSQCAVLSVGLSQTVLNGNEYDFSADGLLPAVDGGYGWCGSYFDVAGRARFVFGPDYLLVLPQLLLRVHTKSPISSGFEAGFGVRLGFDYLNVWRETFSYTAYDAFGLAGTVGPDVRYWFDEHWGAGIALDATMGGSRGKSAAPGSDYEDPQHVFLVALGLTTGAAYRF